VKGVAGRVRRHHFALEQLHPPAGAAVLIASLFVERAGAGTSVAELLDQIRARIGQDAHLLLHLDQTTSRTLGQDWRHGLEERFDFQLAKDSLAFFAHSAIPSVSPDVPPGVSDVRFRSDLSGIEAVDAAAYRERRGIFRAVLAH
jgi:hypothetical protein